MKAAELVGEAFLSSALQVSLKRLDSVDIKDYVRGRKRIHDLLENLFIILISVDQVLEDAEERQYRNTNVKQWLDELEDAVYVADDLLDEIACEAIRKKVEAESRVATSKVRDSFSSFGNPVDKEIESGIQEVLYNLESLAKEKNVLGLKEGSGGGSEVGVGGKVSNRLPTTSLADEIEIYSRDGDKEEIIKFLLCDNERESRPAVISIVGLDGMGKTTLAQLVYTDRRMEDQFQLKTWVCISEEFDVVGITKIILAVLDCSITGYEDLNQLQLKLKDKLIGKKFLIVLDDVGNLNPTSWESLQVPFLYGAPGSKILITTSNEKVAKVMGSIRMQPLKEEYCWELFDKNARAYKNVQLIGDKKCLDELWLLWSGNSEDSLDERPVLRALQPHVNLKDLTIKGYSGTRFVDWFDSLYLPNLVSLELWSCKYCYCLPPLGQHPSLKKLTIYGLEEINEIGPDFYGNNLSIAPFRSLEYLRFANMREWEEWGHVEGECFPCLEVLYIENCPKLTKSLPPHLTCLKALGIRDCEKLKSSLAKVDAMTNVEIQESQVKKSSWMEQMLDTNPYLEELRMDNCPQLVSFPTSDFSALKLRYINFSNLGNLKSIPENMQTLIPSLHTLLLDNCSQIESFPKEGLPSSLVSLSIHHCPKLFASRKDWGLHNLCSLKSFRIGVDLENVESFPEEALLPPNLTFLSLEGWLNLKTLNYKGLFHLESLQTLEIINCPSLQCLPDEGLPNSISSFSIWGNCPLLKQRCQKGKGQDWPKISHIRRLYV